LVSTQEYDDGNLDVPGGAEEPVERVVVIGAGIAGLTAANALANAGVECVVLEARDRIGGRLHTVDVGGVPIDMGGSWIHTPIGNPMRRFADQVGVACREANPLPEAVAYDRVERRRLSADEFGALMEAAFDGFGAALVGMLADLSADAPATEAVERYIAEADLGEAHSRRVRGLIRSYISAEAADLPERQSLRWFGNEEDYGGDDLGDAPVGGYRRLVEAMGGGISVRLGAVVTRIEVTTTGVQAVTADGHAEQGSHLVCTLPLGVLKEDAVRFSPELPPALREAIGRLGFGRFEKIALRFDEPFWRAAGVPHLMFFPEDPDESIGWILGQDAHGAGPALVVLVCHDNSRRVIGRAPEDAARWVLDMVEQAIGAPCPDPTAIATSSWAADPYARGSYCHYPPGASPADIERLGQPILGRLLFAGEATVVPRMGYADGAMQTGIREAKRLLRQPSVSLGPLDGNTVPE
jgi:monoamine oxidase